MELNFITQDPTHYGADINKNIERSVANIQTHIDREDGDLTITWLVDESMRGKKLGQFLIILVYSILQFLMRTLL